MKIGQITDQLAISCVKYYAAYLAKMQNQQYQEADALLALYNQSIRNAANKYTTHLSYPYRDNTNLDW